MSVPDQQQRPGAAPDRQHAGSVPDRQQPDGLTGQQRPGSVPVYRRIDPLLGEFALRPLDPDGDAVLLHSWVTHPKAVFWMMQDADVAGVVAEYRRIAAHPHHEAYLGLWRGEPAFLVERYDPAHVELVGLYDAVDGDIGMHFLCAPTGDPVHGFTRAVITTVMAWLFSDPGVRRVVVEPDVRNTAVHALNEAVGFTVAGPVRKPEKTALLSFCTREQFHAATAGGAVEDGTAGRAATAGGTAAGTRTDEPVDQGEVPA